MMEEDNIINSLHFQKINRELQEICKYSPNMRRSLMQAMQSSSFFDAICHTTFSIQTHYLRAFLSGGRAGEVKNFFFPSKQENVEANLQRESMHGEM